MRKILVGLTRAAVATFIAATLIGTATNPVRAVTAEAENLLAGFTVYERVTYTNVDMLAAGAVRATVITNRAWGEMLADPDEVLTDEDEIQFKNIVRGWVGTKTGPVILDFESTYLRGSITRTEAERRAGDWITMLTWTRQAVPGRMIGIYNFLHEIDPAFMDLATQVAAYEDAFFPAMYSYISNGNGCSDQAGWTIRLDAMVDRADQIDPAQPTIPFIWPQIYPTCPSGGSFVPAAQWRWQLESIRARGISGTLIYSEATTASDLGWYNETVDFIGSLSPS